MTLPATADDTARGNGRRWPRIGGATVSADALSDDAGWQVVFDATHEVVYARR